MSRASKADLVTAIEGLEREQRRLAGLIQDVRQLAERLPDAAGDESARPVAVCPHDGLRFPSPKRLEEHLANVHPA